MPAPLGHEPYNKGEGGRPRRYSEEDIERYADEFKTWLNIDPDLMAEWAAENKKFSGVLKLARYRQESRLINGGLMNVYNGSIVKLVLSNAHGWKTEKSEARLSGDAQNPLACILNAVDGATKKLVE